MHGDRPRRQLLRAGVRAAAGIPKASDYHETTVVLRTPGGRISTLKTGYANPDSLVWSASAPDLVVATWPLKAEAITTSGNRAALPGGWFPMGWNPAGTKLLVARIVSV
jgi:hypothetical protein